MRTDDFLSLRGVAERAISYRFDLLDSDEHVIGALEPARDELTPTITHDTTRGIVRDMANFNLTPVDAHEVNTLTNRIRPWMVLETGEEFSLGVFLFVDPSNPRYSYGLPLASSLVDKGFILDQPVEHTVTAPEGVFIRTVILRLLNELNIDVIIETSPTVLRAPLTWNSGTSLLVIITNLCTAAGLFPPFFDRNGVCNILAVFDPAEQNPVATYRNGENIYAASPIETNDLLNVPNRYVVICTDTPNVEIVGVYDVPANAPFSFYSRGFRVTEVVDQQGIATAGEAEHAARAYAVSRQIYERVTFLGPPDPRHDGYSTVEYLGERWLEQGWSLPLSPSGPMTHILRKVYT